MDKSEKNIYCSIHKERQVNYLRIHEDDSNIFKCHLCIVQDEISPQELVSLIQILESNQDQIIRNWPPLEDANLIEQIEQEIKIGDKIAKKINGIFDNFQNDFIESLSKLKKAMLRKVEENKLSSFDEFTLKQYNEIAEVSKLKEVLQFTLNEGEDSKNQIKDLFQIAIKNKNKNTEDFVKLLKQLKENDNIMDLSLFFAQRDLILSMIDQFQPQSDENPAKEQNPSFNLNVMSILNTLMSKSNEINLKMKNFQTLEQLKRIEDLTTEIDEDAEEIEQMVNFKNITFKEQILDNYKIEKEQTNKDYTNYISSCNQIIITISKLEVDLIQQIKSLIDLIHNNHLNNNPLLTNSSTIFK